MKKNILFWKTLSEVRDPEILQSESTVLLKISHKKNESCIRNGNENLDDEEATFIKLISSNRPFRLYLLSYLISHAGEWFTYVASIELLERLLGSKSATSRKYVSLLVVCRLVPSFLLVGFGGILADVRDRRTTMIILDFFGAIVPILNLLASYFKSIKMIYVTTFLQASISALYEPCRTSIVPLMVTDDEYMKKATTLAGLAWSVMASVGSGAGGYMVGRYGVNACFVLDSASFLVSGLILCLIRGSWDVSQNGNEEYLTVRKKIEDMIVKGFKYIACSEFWPLICLKMSLCSVYGGFDILNVSFAEENPNTNEAERSQRLGALFFSVGLGCLVGPIIVEPFTQILKPRTMLNACVFAFALQAAGSLSMGYFLPFSASVLSTMTRSAGSSIIWIESQILLQTVVDPEMLGRVVAIDYGLALAFEALSATLAGILQDNLGLNAREVSTILGIAALALFVLWLCYSIFGSAKLLDTKFCSDKSSSSGRKFTEKGSIKKAKLYQET